MANNSDSETNKVYAYTVSGQRDEDADFNLVSSDPFGIIYASDRLYVVDGGDNAVYAYTSAGQ
ncbi:MAG: hypothetical protein F4175_19870 [Gemmatimonadetes bacterium]|nr:hypothetical protein [Gemmatimonadota bacterium]